MSSRVRDVLSTAATAVLVLCAVVVTSLLVMREISGQRGGGAGAAQAFRKVSVPERLADEGSLIGSPDAEARIVVFSDFQCPFCARVVADVDDLLARHQGRVAVVFRHFPIEAIHPHARTAAMAAECAGAQGRFRPYHDALFAGQADIGERSWSDFARTAGVPSPEEFDRCVREERFAERVRRDLEAAGAVGVNSTPTFVFDGVMATGAPGLALLEARLAKTLRR